MNLISLVVQEKLKNIFSKPMMVPYAEMKDIVIVKRFETIAVISDYKCFSAKNGSGKEISSNKVIRC